MHNKCNPARSGGEKATQAKDPTEFQRRRKIYLLTNNIFDSRIKRAVSWEKGRINALPNEIFMIFVIVPLSNTAVERFMISHQTNQLHRING